MKLRKIISLAVTSAIVMANAVVISMPSASAETVNTPTTYSENFESFGELNQQNTLLTLKDSGWYACDHTQLYTDVSQVAPYSTMSYKLANIETVDDSKVLRIITAGGSAGSIPATYGYGRALPGVATNGAATGVYNIQFDYKPILSGGKTQFYFGLNTADGSATSDTNAQHNIFSGYDTTFYLGYRNYLTIYNSKITQGSISATGSGVGGVTWYTIKATVDCDNKYYSVEFYNRGTGKLIARRSPISFAGNESVGFIKFSALGLNGTYAAAVYIDNISIEKTTRNTLIYEDGFEYSTSPTASEVMTVNGDDEDIKGSSYFEGYTPWRGIGSIGIAYGLEDDATLDSQVVRLGNDPSAAGTQKSGLVYAPVREMLLTNATAQLKRGKVKVSFKIKPDTIGSTAFQMYSMADHTTDNASKVFEISDNSGTPAINGENLNSSKWYDAEVVLDPANKAATVTLKDHSTQAIVTEFTNGYPKITAIKGIMFNVVGGTTVYMDDAKIEYFEANPTYDASKVVLTDRFGSVIAGTSNITAAVKSIKVPFGCDLNGTTASTSTIFLKDSSDNTVAYTATRYENSYKIDLGNSLLKQGETYTLTIPSTVANIYGVALGGDDRTFTFTTTNTLSDLLRIKAVKIGGVDVSALSDITAGSTINVETKYANSTEDTIQGTALLVFYGNNKVIKVLTNDIAVAAGDCDTDDFSFNVPLELDMSAVDKASVLLWDGFANITPYCDAFNFINE